MPFIAEPLRYGETQTRRATKKNVCSDVTFLFPSMFKFIIVPIVMMQRQIMGARVTVKVEVLLCYLPPASEGWGKVIFSLCVSVHRGGEGYPSQVLTGGYPIPGPDGGIPH